ncbi:ribosome maturation factor RimP [Frankia sp. ACN1ag]|uniref:ribosome maturation factor RimP n=1 Tax=Frankia sp. ACN1ag TaxID=102891 RepID=UPI0006DCC633|nr:ribosome maturation factor RimP [Frankia sp. ACN1ag]
MSGAGESGHGRGRGSSGAARRAGTVRPALRDRLTSGLAGAGFDLEDVTVSRAGSRSLVRVAVDRDGGIDLDAVAEASRVVSDLLDAAEAAGEGLSAGPYVLEVTSPGVDRPLTAPRHWRRAVGRLVTVRDSAGDVLSGRVLSADEAGADLAVATGPARRGRPQRRRVARVTYAQVERATVEVEFAAEGYDDLSGESPAQPSGDTPDAPDSGVSAEAPQAHAARDGATRDDQDDHPASPGPVSNDEGRQADAQGAAGEEMTR